MTDQTAVRLLIRRRSVLLLPVLLAACTTESPPQNFPPLAYDYLTKLKLNVANIDIDDSWTPHVDTGLHVESMSPVQPLDALRRLAHDRLIPGGASGQAQFTIDDASIVQLPDGYHGSLAVHLDVDVNNAGGTHSGHAEARVTRVRIPGDDTSPEAVRAGLYEMTRQMMDDINVEFEYQLRRSLSEYLQTTSPGAPSPPPVQSQDLDSTSPSAAP